MLQARRGWAAWALVVLFGCSSSESGPSPSAGAGGSSAGAGGSSSGAGGSSAGAGPGGAAGSSDSGASAPCVDRSLPSCQPKVIGPPGGAGTGLTVVGGIAYWRQFSKPAVLLRTSLNDDQTTEVT